MSHAAGDCLLAIVAERMRSYGHRLASAKLDEYRLARVHVFQMSAAGPFTTFGDRAATDVTLLDMEAYREYRRHAGGVSAVAVNHDLRLMRKIFNWAVRKGLLTRTTFKSGSEPVIQLGRETLRHWRFQNDEEEQRLLDAANPHLGVDRRDARNCLPSRRTARASVAGRVAGAQ